MKISKKYFDTFLCLNVIEREVYDLARTPVTPADVALLASRRPHRASRSVSTVSLRSPEPPSACTSRTPRLYRNTVRVVGASAGALRHVVHALLHTA